MQEDISPAAMPFNSYEKRHSTNDGALNVLHYVAMAKRMLLQERVQNFEAADVVALAGLIAAETKRLSGGK